jgi:hypothetical protein
VLTCMVYPAGSGYLTWRSDGKLIKYEQRLVSKLELVTPSDGEYRCYGNLTLGGYKYFLSNAYATGKIEEDLGFIWDTQVYLYESRIPLATGW